jgi:hypothetical protein
VLDTGGICNANLATVNVAVQDNNPGVTNQAVTHVQFTWSWGSPAWSQDQTVGGPAWSAATPRIPHATPIAQTDIVIRVTAFDAQGQASSTLQATIILAACDTPPVVDSVTAEPLTIFASSRCGATQSTVAVKAHDDSGAQLNAGYEYVQGGVRNGGAMKQAGLNVWTAVIGPFPNGGNEKVVVSITVVDAANNPAFGSTTITLNPCIIIG